MRGRKPNPNKLKLVRGNPGKRPMKKGKPKPADKMLACPAFLDKVAKREWRRITKVLAGTGLFAAADIVILAGYCAAYSTWIEAQKNLREHGRVVLAAGGQSKLSPWNRVSNQAFDQIFKLSGELGLTPMARVRLIGSATIPTPETEIEDDFSDLD
jgi:P27 family predicted phage terminase small subunit